MGKESVHVHIPEKATLFAKGTSTAKFDFDNLFEHMLNGIAYCRVIYESGIPADFVYIYTNKAFHSQTGLGPVEGKSVSEVISGILETDQNLIKIYGRVASGGKPERFETYVEALQHWFDVSVYSPEPEHFVSTFDIISSRKNRELELEQSQNSAHIGSWYWDAKTDKNIASAELCRMCGRDSIPPFSEQNGTLFPTDAWKVLNAAVQEAVRTGIAYNLDLPALRSDGTQYWVNTRGGPVLNTAGEVVGLRGTVQDITERKQTEEALRHTQALLANAEKIGRVGGWEIDVQTGQTTWTEAVYDIYELNGTDRLTVDEGINYYTPESRPIIGQAVQRAIEQDEPFDLELEIISAKGNRRSVHAVGKPDRRHGKVSGFFQDITERKLAEHALQAALEERNALLKEVHHRVKNNMQVITSLLRLESGRSTVDNTKAVLGDMQARIRTMALLHESLYRTGNFASVDLGRYLRQLSTQAFQAQFTNSGVVQLELNLGSVQVSMDQAIPCGLLVNELISNCFKHGFSAGVAGHVRIELQPLDTATQWCLRVCDTGVGLPDNFEEKRKNSLGLRLVGDLARQIGGELKIAPNQDKGASFTVNFKALEPAPLVMPT